MTIEKATNIIATGAVASPVWMPGLRLVSEFAALLLPIAGLLWLSVQIYMKIRWKK